LPRQRRPPARGQEFEPVVKQDSDLRGPQHHRARSRKLDRERNAVQPPADRGDRAEVFTVRLEIRTQRSRPGHEQLDRGVCEHGLGRHPGRRRHAERRDAIDVLAFDTQRFAAGRQNGHAGAAADDRLGQAGRGIDQMLAIVQDQQQPPASDRPRNGIRRDILAFQLDAQRAGDGRGNQFGLCKRRKLDQQAVDLGAVTGRSRGLQRQRRLADPAGSHQADDTIGRQQIPQMDDRAGAPDQIERRGRYVGRGRGGGRHRFSRRINVPDAPGSQQAIAATDRRPQHVAIGTERLADRRDVDAKRTFVDKDAAPHLLGQIVLGDQFAVGLHQFGNNFKGPSPQRDQHAHGAQFPLC
jgi:hypothetical protein